MRFAVKAGLVCVVALAATATVGAMKIAVQPLPVRVARADVIVAGKVSKIEDKTVSVPAAPGAPSKIEYQIAVVKVDDPILNAKGVKEIRVGFIPPPVPGGPRPGGPIIGPRFPGVSLAEDEVVCLFLTKAPEGDFYVIDGFQGAIKKANNENYAKEVEEVQKAAKLLADPMTSLKSKDAGERFQTAAMLVERYRTQKPPYTNPPKQEPIDAAESKLILEALRDADWAPPKPGVFNTITPLAAFYRLGLTKEDKWEPPQPQPNVPYTFNPSEAAQAWLKDNAGAYKIKKFVADKKDKEPEKKDK